MNESSFALRPEISYPVEYAGAPGSPHNLEFRGKGLLTIHQDERGTRFTFSGPDRKTRATEASRELVFREDEIWNVAVDGRCIQFATTVGKSGENKKPFVFCCPAVEDTIDVAGRLPKTKDADFLAAEDFNERLHNLPGATNEWASITRLLIGANVLAYIAMGLLGAGWIEVQNMEPYVRYGANNAILTAHGQWWRIVACMFLHYGVIHLAFNMWALLQSGHLAEKLLGRPLFVLTYFGSGIVGSFVTLVWHGDKVWSAGASGAIFGIFGALIGYMVREKHALPRATFQPLLKSTLAFTGYNLLFGLAHPKIDNAAHIGGLVGGLILGWIVALPVDADARARMMPRRFALATAVLAVAVAIGVKLALRGVQSG